MKLKNLLLSLLVLVLAGGIATAGVFVANDIKQTRAANDGTSIVQPQSPEWCGTFFVQTPDELEFDSVKMNGLVLIAKEDTVSLTLGSYADGKLIYFEESDRVKDEMGFDNYEISKMEETAEGYKFELYDGEGTGEGSFKDSMWSFADATGFERVSGEIEVRKAAV